MKTFDQILKVIKNKVRQKDYVMTIHAVEEMEDDQLSIYDIEHGLLTSTILEQQKDFKTHESKYRLRGETLTGEGIEIIVKLSPIRKVVIITVYSV